MKKLQPNWEKHWSTADLQAVLQNAIDDGLFIPLVKKYLPKEGVVLEGGGVALDILSMLCNIKATKPLA